MPNLEGSADDGVFRKTRFAPLQVTGFSNKEGWGGRDLRRGGSMVVEQRGKFGAATERDMSAVKFEEDVMRLTN